MSSEVPCHRCGYDVRAQPPEGICPECRASVAESRRVAAFPVRPPWAESDPRWRRRVLAGVWVLALLPLMDAMRTFGWDSHVPVPNVLPYQGAVTTLQDTLLSWPAVYTPLVFCVGVVLLFSRERGRRRGKWDWTRRWGVICSYIVLLLSAASVFYICGLVLAGIGAAFQSMPLKYQPRVTQLLVDVGAGYLRYVYPGSAADVVGVAFSSIVMLLACMALFDALRSTGRKRAAAILLAPLALFALIHLAQAGQYFLRLGFAPAANLLNYWVYFWPELLVKRLAGVPMNPRVQGTGAIALVVEAVKWGIVLAIAVWLSVAQVRARRGKDRG